MEEHPKLSPAGFLKKRLHRFLTSYWFSVFLLCVILIDSWCICFDVDSRAAAMEPPRIVPVITDLCILVYTVDLCTLVVATGWASLIEWGRGVDLFAVLCAWAEFLVFSTGNEEVGMVLRGLSCLRVFRAVRLAGLLGRKTHGLHALYKLISMMSRTFKELFWSFIFCFAFMTAWAVLFVEVAHPMVLRLQANQRLFEDCPGCLRAFSSVMDANLSLFKTAIVGDAWGDLAVPLIQANPAVALLFVGSQLTLVFGVLNGIVAVVVEAFAEARTHDVLVIADEMEKDFEKDAGLLLRRFNVN